MMKNPTTILRSKQSSQSALMQDREQECKQPKGHWENLRSQPQRDELSGSAHIQPHTLNGYEHHQGGANRAASVLQCSSSLWTDFIFHAANIEETNSIAAKILQKLGQQGVISLEGPLGAGKTHFVKGIAIAMELTEEVTSPTFTLLQSYGSREKRLHHGDFYRLQSEAEAIDLGLDDYFSEGLTIIEWGNKFPNVLPKETIRIVITPLENEVRKVAVYFPW